MFQVTMQVPDLFFIRFYFQRISLTNNLTVISGNTTVSTLYNKSIRQNRLSYTFK